MTRLMLMSGGEEVTREQVDLIYKPAEATKSYTPYSYGEQVDLAKKIVNYQLGYKLRAEQYGLNQDGMQFFFALTYDTGSEAGFTIAGRNSTNKTLTVAYVGGARVMICDNLALHGDALKVQRKHTKNVRADIDALCLDAVKSSVVAHKSLAEMWEKMRGYPVCKDRGYEIMGRALGYDVIKPQQITPAMAAWDEDLHGFGRSLFGVYQAFTEGCKRGAPNQTIDRLTAVNAFLTAEMDHFGALTRPEYNVTAQRPTLATVPSLEID